MKQKFSTKWKASKQPRKKRKYIANAPIHVKKKLLSANLSKDLRKKYGKRSFPVRKGDNVIVMRGKFKKKTGKINLVNIKQGFVSIEGLQIGKKDGTKINVKFNPSNLQIKELNLDDKKRKTALERKATEPTKKTKDVEPSSKKPGKNVDNKSKNKPKK